MQKELIATMMFFGNQNWATNQGFGFHHNSHRAATATQGNDLYQGYTSGASQTQKSSSDSNRFNELQAMLSMMIRGFNDVPNGYPFHPGELTSKTSNAGTTASTTSGTTSGTTASTTASAPHPPPPPPWPPWHR